MFDSHCHLDFPEIFGTLESELAGARAAGIEGWLVPGCEPSQWARLEAFARVPGVRVALGLHPWWAPRVIAESEGALDSVVAQLATDARRFGARAIGELGLDGARVETSHPDFELQRRAFEAQLASAVELELPVVLHAVRAHGPMLQSLRRVGVPRAGGVVHGFSGSLPVARDYMALGLHVGIGCQVTSSLSRRMREAAAALPLERLVVETDAPDQRPREADGAAGEARPGRPTDLVRVIAAVAELRGLSTAEVGRATAQNACALFGA